MHWSQSVSTSKFSLGRHSPSVPKKTWAIFLGPEFRDPFHLVKNQVEVFRCEAHISLLGMVISGWAATSMFESSWGGAAKSCLALRKRRRDCALASIFWLVLSVFLCFFSHSHPLCSSFFLHCNFFFISDFIDLGPLSFFVGESGQSVVNFVYLFKEPALSFIDLFYFF